MPSQEELETDIRRMIAHEEEGRPLLRERVSVIDYELRQLARELAAIKTAIDSVRNGQKTNWPLILIMSGAAFATLAFIVAALELPLAGRIDGIITTLERQSAETQWLRDSTTKSAGADAASVIDRANLNQKTIDNTKLINELSSRMAGLQSDFSSRTTEVETQVDATAQSLAIQFAETQRRFNELSTSVSGLGGKLPPGLNDPFIFPNMSNRSHEKAVQ